MILDPLAEVMEADDGQATLAAVSIIRSAAQSWLWMGSVWGRGEGMHTCTYACHVQLLTSASPPRACACFLLAVASRDLLEKEVTNAQTEILRLGLVARLARLAEVGVLLLHWIRGRLKFWFCVLGFLCCLALFDLGTN